MPEQKRADQNNRFDSKKKSGYTPCTVKGVTIEDVAREAGVSRQTVSRAINDKGEISPKTKAKVLAAIQQLGYTPNLQARSMVTQRTSTIGLIVGDIANPYFSSVARGLQDIAGQHGYSVFISNTDENADVEHQALKTMAAQRVDGIVLFSHELAEEKLIAFANTYRPIVLINRAVTHPNIHLMAVDHVDGIRQSFTHIWDAGHRNIGMLSPVQSEGFKNSRRLNAFKAEMKQRGLSIENKIFPAQSTFDGGHAAMLALLKAQPDVSAVICYNDRMAIGALQACRETGRSVPGDISIVGFDNIRVSGMVTPPLTTAAVDRYELGRVAVESLLKLINDDELSLAPRVIPMQLVERESVTVAPTQVLVN